MWTGGSSADRPRVGRHARPVRAVPKADIRCVRGVEIGNVTRLELSGACLQETASRRVGTTNRLTRTAGSRVFVT